MKVGSDKPDQNQYPYPFLRKKSPDKDDDDWWKGGDSMSVN